MERLIPQSLADRRITAANIWWTRFLLLLNLTPPIFIWLSGGTVLWFWCYAVVVHSILLWAIFHPSSNLLGRILTCLPTTEKVVWLTIDDGPSEDTAELAALLESLGVSATFFLIGKNLATHPDAAAAVLRHGHTIANHTQNHKLALFWILPPWRVAREVDDFQSTLNRMELESISAFRCPAGIKNPFLPSILRRRNLTLAGWTVRACDGFRCHREKSLARIVSGLRPGAILLLHEGKKDAEGRPASVELIREVVVAVQAAGYRFAQ